MQERRAVDFLAVDFLAAGFLVAAFLATFLFNIGMIFSCYERNYYEPFLIYDLLRYSVIIMLQVKSISAHLKCSAYSTYFNFSRKKMKINFSMNETNQYLLLKSQ